MLHLKNAIFALLLHCNFFATGLSWWNVFLIFPDHLLYYGLLAGVLLNKKKQQNKYIKILKFNGYYFSNIQW